jgi:hypothetical protein
MVNSEELIRTTEYLTLHKRCRINRCRYNSVWSKTALDKTALCEGLPCLESPRIYG